MPTLDNFSLGNYGLGGPTDVIKYATGVALSTAANYIFDTVDSQINLPYIQVSGLIFRPNRIIVRKQVQNVNSGMVTYNKDSRGANPGFGTWNIADWHGTNGGAGYLIQVYELNQGDPTNRLGFVNDTGFRLPVFSFSENYVWEAYKV